VNRSIIAKVLVGFLLVLICVLFIGGAIHDGGGGKDAIVGSERKAGQASSPMRDTHTRHVVAPRLTLPVDAAAKPRAVAAARSGERKPPSNDALAERVPVISAADLSTVPAGDVVIDAPDVPKHDPYDVVEATDEERKKMKRIDEEFTAELEAARKGGLSAIRAAVERYQEKAAEVLGSDRAEMLLNVMEWKGRDLAEQDAVVDPFLVQ